MSEDGLLAHMATEERVSTGIPGLDPLIEGGFKQGSVNLVSGGAGSGKTTFAIQFLVEGLRKGEAGIYITFEEKREKLFEDMREFGWDLAAYEQKGIFRFIEYTPEQIKRLLVEGGGTVDALVTQMHAKRLGIDSISSFAMLFQNELTKKESSLALFEMISRWGCTAVLTAEAMELGGADLTMSNTLQFEVDSIILIYHYKQKGVRKRALEVLKMRGTKSPDKTFRLLLTSKGIQVDADEIVAI